MLLVFFIWQKYTSQSLKNAIGKQVDKNGNVIPAPDIKSPQDQVDAVRGMVKNLQDKKNSEIQKEMDKSQ
jgi:hypothetical protein